MADPRFTPFELRPEAKTLLDLGCGPGLVALHGAARNMRVTAVDSRKETPTALRNIPAVTYLSADLSQPWIIPAVRWDIVTAHYVLHFLPRERVADLLNRLWNGHLNTDGILHVLAFTSEDATGVPTPLTGAWLKKNIGIGPQHIVREETIRQQDDHPPQGKHEHQTIHLLLKKSKKQ